MQRRAYAKVRLNTLENALKMVRCDFVFVFLDSKVGWHSGRQPKNKEPTVKQTIKGRQSGTNTENKYHTQNDKTPECLEILNKQSKRSTRAKDRGGKITIQVKRMRVDNHNSGKQYDSR